MKSKSKNLGEDSIYSLLFHLSVPAILSMIVAALYNFVDRAFVGNINPLGLTAIGITMPFQIVQMAFVLLIGVGSSTLISIKYGENDLDSAKALLSSAFRLIIITELIITVLCLVFLDDIFLLLKVSNDLYPLAKEYISIILIGGVPSLTGYCLNNSVRSLGFSKESMFIVISSSVVNIILDYIFITVLGYGVKGAAFATVVSQSLVTVFVLYFFSKKYNASPIKLEFLPKHNENSPKEAFYYEKSILYNGLPNFYMQLSGTFTNIFLNSSIMSYGDDFHLASVTIITSISMLFTMIIYGISQGMQPVVGYNFGYKKPLRCVQALKLSIISVLIVCSAGLVVIELFPQIFSSIFTKDPYLRELTNTNLRIYLIGLPMIGIHSISSTFFQSIKKPKLSTLLYILRYGGILIPCLFILPKILGIKGVYISNVLSDSLSGLIAVFILMYVIKDIKKLST